MAVDTLKRFELNRHIKELSRYRGRHTELVSVYVPAGYEMAKIIAHLNQEQGTATNIKSASTRKNVIDALERMIQHLRLFKQTPLHGLAAFSGNVSEREGQSNVKVWSIEPPVPLKIRIYRCDKQFLLEPLFDMLDTKEAYGMIVMDRREGTIGMLKGKSITVLSSASSNVPGKTKAGGQSAHRYERLREDAAKDFYKKLGMMMKEHFLNKPAIKGILVGGPGPTKHDFVDGDYITNEVKKKIITVKDLSYTGEFGLQELLEMCEDVLAAEEVMEEKKIMNRFLTLLSTRMSTVSYGEAQVRKCLEMGAVGTLLLSESLDDKLIEELEKIAKQFNTEVSIISVDTREGVQLRDLGKVAAILRYEVHE